jgi:clan AA aspartic protease
MATVKLVNIRDQLRAEQGDIAQDEVRELEIEALVDTGANMLVLPQEVVDRLGLEEIDRRRVRYADGSRAIKRVVGTVHLEVAGRHSRFNAIAEEQGTTPLIGQIVLEELDLIVDPRSKELRPDPESPDMPTIDVF